MAKYNSVSNLHISLLIKNWVLGPPKIKKPLELEKSLRFVDRKPFLLLFNNFSLLLLLI